MEAIYKKTKDNKQEKLDIYKFYALVQISLIKRTIISQLEPKH